MTELEESGVLDINWPEVVAGFLLGVAALIVRQAYFYFRFRRSPGRRRYLGQWHSYWRSTTETGWIGHQRFHIRYSSIRNTLLVKNLSESVAEGIGPWSMPAVSLNERESSDMAIARFDNSISGGLDIG